jgi:predicted SAM-dependent methyltransferase
VTSFEGKPMALERRLHIGGRVRKSGWEVYNIILSDIVDHVGDARDLSRFADNTFAELYASHVLEHFDYQNEVVDVLREWKRVLQPGGRMYISVPNLDALCFIFSHEQVSSFDDKYRIMRLIFGGHMDEYDYHKSGFFPDLLSRCLGLAGFVNAVIMDNFDLFADGNSVKCAGISISLNMCANKPFGGGD